MLHGFSYYDLVRCLSIVVVSSAEMSRSRKGISLQKAFAGGCPEKGWRVSLYPLRTAVHIAVQSLVSVASIVPAIYLRCAVLRSGAVVRFRAVQRFVVRSHVSSSTCMKLK